MIEIAGKKFYTTREVSETLNMSHETVRRWCREGRIECQKLGDYFISEEVVEAVKTFVQTYGKLTKDWRKFLRSSDV